MRTAQELFNVIQGRQNKYMLVKVSERRFIFLVELNILPLQLLMLGCTEEKSIAGAQG